MHRKQDYTVLGPIYPLSCEVWGWQLGRRRGRKMPPAGCYVPLMLVDEDPDEWEYMVQARTFIFNRKMKNKKIYIGYINLKDNTVHNVMKNTGQFTRTVD